MSAPSFPAHPTLQGLPRPWCPTEPQFCDVPKRELVAHIERQTLTQLQDLRAMANSAEDLDTLADLDQPLIAAELAIQLMTRNSQAWEVRMLSILAAVSALQARA